MKINMQEWANEIIAAQDVRNLPVLFFPVLKNIDMPVPDSVKDPVNVARAMEEVIKEYPDTIAAITGMDLSVDSEAFGAEVKFSKRQAPNVKHHILETADDVHALTIPDIHSGRVDIFNDACREAAKAITDRPIMGGMFGPFSLAANLLDVSDALMKAMHEPELMHELLEKSTEWLIKRAQGYKDAGANGVFIAEPTAGIMNPKMLDEFSSKYIRRIVDAVQDDYFFLILHDCGSVTDSVKSMYETGCKGFHFGNGVDMNNIMPQIPADVLVFGNLDPSEVFTLGTPESIREKTLALLNDMKPYPHFILSSGCDLAPLVSNENLEAYYQACRDFNAGLI
ncbi:MAG: uroporphyrinogen decarboxylase family protein [Mogibacterium sp.]|nr:uroporphyrinogen decarboxylase family protein [Mogibacterium sp.]